MFRNVSPPVLTAVHVTTFSLKTQARPYSSWKLLWKQWKLIWKQWKLPQASMEVVPATSRLRGGVSTIEVPPRLSEAPHLRSSIPHPNTRFGQNQIAFRRIIPWPKYTKTSFFEARLLAYRRVWVKEPRYSKTKIRKRATSIVERVHGSSGSFPKLPWGSWDVDSN